LFGGELFGKNETAKATDSLALCLGLGGDVASIRRCVDTGTVVYERSR
jgi:hypothetical protein